MKDCFNHEIYKHSSIFVTPYLIRNSTFVSRLLHKSFLVSLRVLENLSRLCKIFIYLYIYTLICYSSFKHLGQKGEFLRAITRVDNVLYTNYMPLTPYHEVEGFVIMLQNMKLKKITYPKWRNHNLNSDLSPKSKKGCKRIFLSTINQGSQ